MKIDNCFYIILNKGECIMSNDKWDYQIGDVVTHVEEPNMRGVVINRGLEHEVFSDRPSSHVARWCVIQWVVVPDGKQMYTGREPECQLKLITKSERHFL